ncbi:MAG: thioredoxin [Bacteroidetes bacterium]|nr:thioredoxin [Bacteroidota bacterium]
MQNEHKHTNSLIHESSPYLLQHAHNPVNWHAWNDEALERAKREDKLILVSVGYSACHWCHVMEHESFEDETVAAIMNDHFVCIKVDREERPDIDQVYMLAVQLMTGHGGWPLNCFALPDGRPIYGGTYFPKQQWINVLLNLTDVYSNEKHKALEYAERLTEGVKLAELVHAKEPVEFSSAILLRCYENWRSRFDPVDGGPDKAPKFPLPNNYEFLLRYAQGLENKAEVMQHVNLTLKKMAYGGICDQAGGGFARYSVDHYWKVPHFEKMLYDNAQLVTLYSEAYRATGNELYKETVYDTLKFIARELTSPEGGFYSALDADSEGVEGKYYVWTKEELKEILGKDAAVFEDYFNVNERGLWEHENYILLRHDEDEAVAKRNNIGVAELKKIIKKSCEKLLVVREKRVRPGLDNKILTSWNALMLKGYVDAYNAFGEEKFLTAAKKNAAFLLEHSLDGSKISHLATASGNPKEKYGFLEDYSFSIEAFISLYQATNEERHLLLADELMRYCLEHFEDKSSGMFFFTSDEDKALITRKMELSDNVIPASNSSIAKSLFVLGHYFEKDEYIEKSRKMLNNVLEELENYGAGYSNWAMLLLWFTRPFYELAIVGKSVDEKYRAFQKHYLPNVIFAGSAAQSSLPLLKNRFVEGRTLIYVCTNKTCLAPVDNAEAALSQITGHF